MPDAMASMDAQIADLKAKFKARSGKSAYRDNLPFLEAEINRLEAAKAVLIESANSEKDQNNG